MVQGMKWFWYSLIGFCVLMCSCKTQKSARLINEVSKGSIQTEWSKFGILVDTTKTFRVGIDKSKLRIIETIKITEYDAESGKPIKETEAKRETTQDTDKVVSEEGKREVTEENDILLKQKNDFSKTLDSEEKLESIGGQESFGKWFGIGIACVFGFLIIYLMKKLRIN
jgi:hypothetical protein